MGETVRYKATFRVSLAHPVHNAMTLTVRTGCCHWPLAGRQLSGPGPSSANNEHFLLGQESCVSLPR